MRIAIKREGANIVTARDFDDVEDRGEIAHFICELDVIRGELLKLWEEYDG